MFATIETPVDISDAPVTLDEVKAHLRVTSTDEDDVIDSYILTAMAECENILKQKLSPQVWRLYFDTDDVVDDISLMDFAPITSIVVKNAAGVTLAAPTIELVRKRTWYATLSAVPTAATDYVCITCGYADPDLIPAPIKHWIKMRVGAYMEFRESSQDSNTAPVDFLPQLLWPYRHVAFF